VTVEDIARGPRVQDAGDAGVEGNSRLTAVTGALLFVALAVEGITILRVRDLLGPHVFVGMVVGALVVMKLGSTGYRFVRYYRGDPAYVRKGPPHPILRVIGPLVVVTSVAVVLTGVVLLRGGESARDPWLGLHKATFIVWIVLMAVHVVGHLRETVTLSVAEAGIEPASPAPGRAARFTVLVVTLAVGVGTGLAAVDWASGWRH
jgi:hypothetical protein